MRTALAFLTVAMAGCASVAQVTNLGEPACQETFTRELASVLSAEGETPERASQLAEAAAHALHTAALGPRPFLVASPSGVDYSFFVQRKRAGCLLRLYARQKGFVSYTNNLNYIATRQLSPCACSESSQ